MCDGTPRQTKREVPGGIRALRGAWQSDRCSSLPREMSLNVASSWLCSRHALHPTRMAILERCAASVADSPNFLDMTFAGRMGMNDQRSAAMAEAKEEVNIELPRPGETFFNAESRHVFAIRFSERGVGVLKPLDREVGSLVLAPLDEAWALFRAHDIASALRVTGPHALYHTLRGWGWKE